MSTTDTDETVLSTRCTNILVPSKAEEQKEDNMEDSFGDGSKTYLNLDDTIDNIV